MPTLDTTRYTYTLSPYKGKPGKAFDYWHMTRVRGKKHFLSIGYTQSKNPTYMRNGEEIVFFNRIVKVWKTDLYTP